MNLRRHAEQWLVKLYNSRALRPLNDRVLLQFRPTFDRNEEPKLDEAHKLYDFLRTDWDRINDRGDLVRYYFLYLQLRRLEEQSIVGDVAELGVYKGNTAFFFRRVSPGRRLHLFDTFSGFSCQDSAEYAEGGAFADVSMKEIRKRFGSEAFIYKGYFPDTAEAIPPGTKFAMVHIDMDLDKPIAAALKFFYPRVEPGGAIIVHDYNNTASWDRGAKKAVDAFLADKAETGVEMPDRLGSLVIIKQRSRNGA
jgi:O-methyltransferase